MGGSKGMLAPPLSNYWGGGAANPAPSLPTLMNGKRRTGIQKKRWADNIKGCPEHNLEGVSLPRKSVVRLTEIGGKGTVVEPSAVLPYA